ncbi:uncharacterized protein LOC108740959 isoform X2 [Agrilus planipennis]|uniref:Uncharacterized protein LOC108740959 isoform X2 n=1 Tax=Agrilus planipennis TaxID=224129 RepID=A0A1W4X4G7_AGRPL|nr:uncharacterized protein LOC108740959 isoform X2 [Agrilus planipennis]
MFLSDTMSFEINSSSSVSHKSIHRGDKSKNMVLNRSNIVNQSKSKNFSRHNNCNKQNYIPNFNIPGSCSYSVPFSCLQEGPMSLPPYPLIQPMSSSYIQRKNKMNSYNYPNLNNMLQNEPNEYMSLPVVNGDENENSRDRRRFSDPGLPCDSDSSSHSCEKRIVKDLMQEIDFLKDSNQKLAGEINELRMEVNILKQQQNMKYNDREYEPGMLAEVIKEIRDAARVREDALLSKIKHMIEEKQFSMTQFHMATEKNRHNERLTKLEEQMKNLSTSSITRDDLSLTEEGISSAKQVLELEREALTLRRELQETRAKKEESDQKLFHLTLVIENKQKPNDEWRAKCPWYSPEKAECESQNPTEI